MGKFERDTAKTGQILSQLSVTKEYSAGDTQVAVGRGVFSRAGSKAVYGIAQALDKFAGFVANFHGYTGDSETGIIEQGTFLYVLKHGQIYLDIAGSPEIGHYVFVSNSTGVVDTNAANTPQAGKTLAEGWIVSEVSDSSSGNKICVVQNLYAIPTANI